MTPRQHLEALRRLQARTAILPAATEPIAQRAVLDGIPGTVSMRVNRVPGGSRILLSGHGAAAHARVVAPRLRAGLRDELARLR